MIGTRGRWTRSGIVVGSGVIVGVLLVAGVIASADDDAESRATAARALLAAGKTADAIVEYDRGRQVDPSEEAFAWSPAERLDLALGFLDLGREEEALLQVIAARQAAPTLGRTNYVLGRIQHARGDVNRASEALDACAFPATGAGSIPEEQRRCQMALAALYARTGNLSRAQEVVAGLAKEGLVGPDQAALRLLSGLIRHGRGDIPRALAEFAPELGAPGTPGFVLAYYAILQPTVDPALRERLAAMLATTEDEMEAPFLARWGRAALAGPTEEPRLLSAALEVLFERPSRSRAAREPVWDASIRALQRAVENDLAQVFVGELQRRQNLLRSLVQITPKLVVRPLPPTRRGHRFVHFEITVTPARGVKAIEVAPADRSRPSRFGVAELRGRGRGDRLQLFVSLPSSVLSGGLQVNVEMLGSLRGPEPFTVSPVAFNAPRPHLQVLAVGVDRYRGRILTTATRDAVSLAAAFSDVLFGQATVELLLNEQVSKARILEWLGRPRAREDVLVVFLRGLEASVLGADSSIDWAFVLPEAATPKESFLSSMEIVETLKRVDPETAIVILDGEASQPLGLAIARFLQVLRRAGESRTELPLDKSLSVLFAHPPFQGETVVSAVHGHSLHTVALLEGLNGFLHLEPYEANRPVRHVDVWNYVAAYFQRSTVRNAFSLSTGQQPFAVPIDRRNALVWATGLRDRQLFPLLRALDEAATHADASVRDLARLAAGAIRKVSRGEEWQARLDLLDSLRDAAQGDVAGLLERWAAGTGLEGGSP